VDFLFKPVVPAILRSKVAVFLELAENRERLAAANRDLTASADELRRAERKYRTLVEQLPAVAFLAALDEAAAPLYVSPQIQRLLGFPPAEWTADAGLWLRQVHPDDRPRLTEGRARGRRTGEPFACEYRILTRDGAVRWVREESVVVTDDEGRPAFSQGLLLDRTEHRQFEILERERDAAAAASRAKTWFLASVSHELRTPLNSIIGFANVLARDDGDRLSPEASDYVQRIRKNGRQLLEIINNILDVTRIEAGRMELRVTPASIPSLVADVVAQLQPQAGAKHIRIVADFPKSLAPIETDSDKLRQVLLNLAGNAIKFTERGTVTVRVAAAPGTRRPAIVEVADTGIGIPRDKLESVFEAFTQADAGLSRRHEGAGLGLTITRALLDVMGYRLEVESVVGQGSVFRVHLSARCGTCDLAADIYSAIGPPVQVMPPARA
jgi:PAS domain S-box-containing protein